MVDFGATDTTRALTIGNSGNSPIQFAATGSNLLTVTPAAGTIPPSGTATLTVVFDRANARPGFSGSITIATDAGQATVLVSATVVDPGPSIRDEALNGCVVTATITGKFPVRRATVTWAGKAISMTKEADGTTWTATVIPSDRSVRWSISAEDDYGVKTSTAEHGPVRVQTCPTGG
jgi:hypothetical protein